MPVIVNIRFGFWIPSAYLMSEMNSASRRSLTVIFIFLCSKPSMVLGEMIFFYWVRLILGAGAGFEARPSGYEPDELPDCSTLLQELYIIHKF